MTIPAEIPAKDRKVLEDLLAFLPDAPFLGALEAYKAIWELPGGAPIWLVAEVARHDRYFLLSQLLRRPDALHPWIYARCREVEADPEGYLDLWSRGHYKSTNITFAGSIQEIIKNPEITIGICSNTNRGAKDFLGQIKSECESNPNLPLYFPDIFWKNPQKESPSWNVDSGILVKRQGNPKEKTVEAFGLIDAQPTGKHYKLIIYDDIVTEDSVGTADQIAKTTERWELSKNLLTLETEGGVRPRVWYAGTRYHYADTYQVMIDRGVIKLRRYPATDNGMLDGNPVLLTKEAWERKKKEESKHTIACQQLLDPLAGTAKEFEDEWIRRYEVRPETLNVAILVDPALSRDKEACRSAFAVIGVDHALNKYLLDGACHRMNLTERWRMLKYLRAKWLRARGVQVVMIGYERYGMQSDIEHFQEMMRLEGVSFPISEVNWTGDGKEAKDDRIRRLVPDHQNWRFFYPYEGKRTRKQMEMEDRGWGDLVAKPIKRVDEENKIYNLVEYLITEEYKLFPFTTAKDFLDAMSRIYDVGIGPPMVYRDEDLLPEYVGEA